MASFNKVLLMGNLTRDPQVKHLPSNMTVAEFGLAVSRRFKTANGEDREEVAFVDCTAFGKQAETISQYCTKGKPLFVEGRLKFDTWEDKTGNGKRSKLTVVVETFQFLPSGDRSGGGGMDPFRHPGTESSSAPPPRELAPAEAGAASGGGEQAEMFANRRGNGGGGNGGSRLRGKSAGDRRPVAAGASAEKPYGEEKQFTEADIPF